MPRYPDPAIFVLTTDTTDHFTPCACARGNNDDDTTDYFTPCACARGTNDDDDTTDYFTTCACARGNKPLCGCVWAGGGGGNSQKGIGPSPSSVDSIRVYMIYIAVSQKVKKSPGIATSIRIGPSRQEFPLSNTRLNHRTLYG